jgi:hypothetical protein
MAGFACSTASIASMRNAFASVRLSRALFICGIAVMGVVLFRMLSSCDPSVAKSLA